MTAQHLPLISVYMPTYNRVQMAIRAIESVLAQDYPHIELLVVDDASTDDTWQVLTNKYINDERIRFFRQSTGQGEGVGMHDSGVDASQGRTGRLLRSGLQSQTQPTS